MLEYAVYFFLAFIAHSGFDQEYKASVEEYQATQR